MFLSQEGFLPLFLLFPWLIVFIRMVDETSLLHDVNNADSY